MEFDKSKGFCEGVNIRNGGCEFTFHSLTHSHSEIAIKNCKKCSCPPARNHRKRYSEEKRALLNKA